MTPVELDTFRAQLIATNKPLALIVCGRPSDYVFDGRPWCVEGAACSKAQRCARCKLELAQLQQNERRMRFLISKSSEEVRRLSRDLPRAQSVLERAATGYRDTKGVVHLRGEPQPLICPHGRDLNAVFCDQCDTDDAETDAL